MALSVGGLTAGGLQFLSLCVNSSYSTTPKLQTSDATENRFSVRDSGAYLYNTYTHTNSHTFTIDLTLNIWPFAVCQQVWSGTVR